MGRGACMQSAAAACAVNDKRETEQLPRVANDEICMLSCVKQSYDWTGATAVAAAAATAAPIPAAAAPAAPIAAAAAL